MESIDPCPPHGSRQPSPVRPISPSQPAESSSSQSTGSSRSVSSNLPQTPVDPEIRPERHESDSVSESNESDTLSDTADDDEPMLKYHKIKGHLSEILARDQASAIALGRRLIALGTQHGMVHILSYEGAKINSYRPHSANVTSIRIDEEDQVVATASFEGRVLLRSLTSPETHAFDYHRPVSALALEPDFNKKSTKAFVCGGMAGKLVLQEKGWLGYKEQVLHSGEGPIWAVEWRGNLIAWANDLGVKIYDTASGQRIGYVDRGLDAPRAELYKCSLLWKDDSTLTIAWADHIKVVRIRNRSKDQIESGMPTLTIELTGIYQMDCMVSGIAILGDRYVVLAYIVPDDGEEHDTPYRRLEAEPPEIRLIDKGEEIMADALELSNYRTKGCNHYCLAKSGRPGEELFLVVSPSEVIEVRPRDEADHVTWLVDHERFEEALTAADAFKTSNGTSIDSRSIGAQYMRHLIAKDEFRRAALLASKVFAQDAKAWTDGIRLFAEHDKLEAILPEIPTDTPRLEPAIYEEVLRTLLLRDRDKMIATIQSWPPRLYRSDIIVSDVQTELDATGEDRELLQCMGEILLADKRPDKALTYFLRLKQSKAIDLIRQYSLFPNVQDQIVLLVEQGPDSGAISLLVDHTHSIPIDRVVRQLEARPEYLFRYLKALFEKEPPLCFPYSDQMITLASAYDPGLLLSIFRASNSYDLEKAYHLCRERDFVPEMVFLLGRMGNNREALMLIIEKLGDVQEAIRFASSQADEDLWEDLLTYSETRPNFIRALLEHVGAEINPIRLIRRIRNGMEISGLKPALIKILQASNLQVSLSEDCHRILGGDCNILALKLQRAQTFGTQSSLESPCAVCGQRVSSGLCLLYLCRHWVHATCALVSPDVSLPDHVDNSVTHLLSGDRTSTRRRELGNKLSHAAAIRTRVGRCPMCAWPEVVAGRESAVVVR
ncbi:hypothetical protein DB88DRAFT_497458 [Papiliotrema laurentii]|uniref:Vacuolar protein sorting-associated protein 41 n=1 Tax=Papiliotrema laurentii TaxID=5418 RepID=A0AAD9CWZ7_PAPLA|nr:hypothetical protein DB88DRAFT_497458 [Papiliotrema laurentii]